MLICLCCCAADTGVAPLMHVLLSFYTKVGYFSVNPIQVHLRWFPWYLISTAVSMQHSTLPLSMIGALLHSSMILPEVGPSW